MVLIDNYQPVSGLDATVLRSCRLIYSEALPILYGQNTFEFASANAVSDFQSKGLIGYPHGRSSLFDNQPFELRASTPSLLADHSKWG